MQQLIPRPIGVDVKIIISRDEHKTETMFHHSQLKGNVTVAHQMVEYLLLLTKLRVLRNQTNNIPRNYPYSYFLFKL